MWASRVESVCQAATDARRLRLDLLDELRRTVPFAWYAWLLTDPVTAVGSSPLAAVPSLVDLPELIRLKYRTGLNRWTAMTEPVAVLGPDRSRSELWREYQSRVGVVDVASLVFADRYGIWGFLDLWRDDHGFSLEERRQLEELVRPATAALRRCLAGTFDGPAVAAPDGPVVILLGPDLGVRAQTAESDVYLRLLVPPEEGRSPVPAGAYNVAAQLLAVEAGVDDRPPTARVHLAGGSWLSLRAARIGSGAPAGSDVAVTIEACPPLDRADLFARVHGLTVRESQVLLRLAAGDDTRAAARSLRVTEYTVQDHLKAVFAKTGAHDRPSLLSAALGTRGGSQEARVSVTLSR